MRGGGTWGSLCLQADQGVLSRTPVICCSLPAWSEGGDLGIELEKSHPKSIVLSKTLD